MAIDNGTIRYRDELIRKLIHLCSLSIPVIYYFITKQLALTILIPLTLMVLVLDWLRYTSPAFAKIFYTVFGFLLRDHEKDQKKKNFNGATFVLISAVLCILIFPKVFFITAFAILIISDTSAALIGRKFGKTKFLSKSLEGTTAFFISACIVVLLSPKVEKATAEYILGFVAAFIGAIAENLSYGWADDNLSIPLSIGFSLWALYAIFLPHALQIINFSI
jgi:dolichol kinase